MPICATNPLNQLSKWPKNLSKTAPSTEFFAHSEGSGAIPLALNPSILIVWVQLRVVGVKILSTGLHCAVLRPKQSLIRPQMTVSEEFLAATTARSLLCFAPTEAVDSC